MGNFSFSATAECERCGKYLSSSDEDCDNCADWELGRYRFIHISEDDRVEQVWAINPIRAWYELGEKVGREPEQILPWRLHQRGMSLHYSQMGYDPTDPETLRQPELPTW